MPSCSEPTQVTWMLAARAGISAVPNIPMFTLVHLGFCTHCNSQKYLISECLSLWSLFLGKQNCTAPQSFISSSFSAWLIPSCAALNAVIILCLEPRWKRMGRTYASAPLQKHSCSWQVFLEEIPGLLQEMPGLPSLPVTKPHKATPGWMNVKRDVM